MAYDLSLYYYLKQSLRVIYLTSSNDHTIIRCPICGDSHKDPRKARLYIANEPPFKWYCFNCDSYGIMNEKLLDKITEGNYDIDVVKEISSKQREFSKTKNKIGKRYYSNPYFKKDIVFSHNKNYLDKLEYLEGRLGVTLDYKDIDKFKIVISLSDFFEQNGLDINKRCKTDKDYYIAQDLDDNYIGFLSADRNIIIFRNINKKEEKYRFNNYSIFGNNQYIDGKKTYVISNQINIMEDLHEISLAEGPIDIISVYLNLLKDKEKLNNQIFIGNGGKGYVSSTEWLMQYGLLNNTFNIYSDNDVNLSFYKNIKKNSPMLKNSLVNIYYNKKAKDFGVKKEMIECTNKIVLK